MKLTPKQKAFAYAYLETGNASEAYRRCYNVKGMSPEAIRVEACRLLDNPNVALIVKTEQDALAKRHEITADKVVRELALIGFANMADVGDLLRGQGRRSRARQAHQVQALG
jgi:phage terminase small subunit